MNNLKVLYSHSTTKSSVNKNTARHIPQQPERIMDAPDLIDDYCKISKLPILRNVTLPENWMCVCHRRIENIDGGIKVLFLSDLNLLDWSANNHIALCLNRAVYLWNAGSGAITSLLELENPDEYVSSVSWISEGNILAVGNSCGFVQVVCSFIQCLCWVLFVTL